MHMALGSSNSLTFDKSWKDMETWIGDKIIPVALVVNVRYKGLLVKSRWEQAV